MVVCGSPIATKTPKLLYACNIILFTDKYPRMQGSRAYMNFEEIRPEDKETCIPFKDEFAVSYHPSCDKINCHILRRDVHAEVRGKVPKKCYDYIYFNPRDLCWRNVMCRKDAKRSIQFHQLYQQFLSSVEEPQST